MQIKKWLINWFESNSDQLRQTIESDPGAEYLNDGWIDSFQFITFINDIEQEFKITFSNDEFQNRDFATIDGLAKIIEGKTNAGA